MPRRSGNSRSTRRRTKYLTYENLSTIAYALAEELFSEWLGPMPVLTVLGGEGGAGRVVGILNLPKQTAGGKPAYPDIFDKTAAIFRSFILNHPFLDGNKRMAAAASLVFLMSNGYIPCPSQEELVHFALGVASGETKDLTSIAGWFRARTLPRDEVESLLKAGQISELIDRLPGRHPIDDRPLLKLLLEASAI